MSKTANAPKQSDVEARAYSKTLRGSPRKLNLVAQIIRGKSAAGALADLTFCERRIAAEVKKVLQSAIANAENNHNLDVDMLYVHTATVGKSFAMKRFHARGRGRSSQVQKPFSNLTVIVRQRSAETPTVEAKAAPAKGKTAGAAKTTTKATTAAKKPASSKAKTKPAAKAEEAGE
jgi:large subunit ribosomal protein L22